MEREHKKGKKKDNKEEEEWEMTWKRKLKEIAWDKLNNCDGDWVKTKPQRAAENAAKVQISKRLRCQIQSQINQNRILRGGGKNNQISKTIFQGKIYYYKERWLRQARAWKVLYLFTPSVLYCWILSTEIGVNSQGTAGTLDVLLLFINMIIFIFNKRRRKLDAYWLLQK